MWYKTKGIIFLLILSIGTSCFVLYYNTMFTTSKILTILLTELFMQIILSVELSWDLASEISRRNNRILPNRPHDIYEAPPWLDDLTTFYPQLGNEPSRGARPYQTIENPPPWILDPLPYTINPYTINKKTNYNKQKPNINGGTYEFKKENNAKIKK